MDRTAIKKEINYLKERIAQRIDWSSRQIKTFGIIMFFNYPLYHLIWLSGSHQEHESLALRLTASFLCLVLVFHNYWPTFLKRSLVLYWYFTASYCLPFFFTYMTLKNNGSTMWLMNCLSALFFLFLLFDAISVMVILLVSIPAAFLFYLYTSSAAFIFIPGTVNFVGVVSTLGAAALIAGVFSHNNDIVQNEKLNAIEMAASNVAHELRTPLATIQAAVSVTNDYLDDLITSYNSAREQNLPASTIPEKRFKDLKPVLEDINNEVGEANAVIDMLLMNAKQVNQVSAENLTVCSIADCINDALSRYPFYQGDEKLVSWQKNNNFEFLGNKELSVHILFNLTKNALYYIKASRKGSINIWTELNGKYNYLHFKDTSAGMDKETLSRLFTRFYSKTYHGYGIGLSYCKTVMNGYHGNITCQSELGEYTEFILKFPQLDRAHSQVKCN